MRTRFKYRLKSEVDLGTLKGPLIITPNHRSYFDAYAVLAAFPLKSGVHPIHTMAADWLYKNMFRRFYLNAVHAIPTLKGQGLEKSLEAPEKTLKTGGTVGIFPEGGLNSDGANGGVAEKARVGAVLLSQHAGAPILPVGIKIEKNICNVFIGKPYSIAGLDTESARMLVMEKIKQQYQTL
ncbi:1-acyl-sn-glycerol-3-phosphate acyltransferase [Candidatus Giovannonibacteria bacterium]|nr:1-acyl-sn-glycerol-3-phosphate acyltransferase [Candidatus Giovannonibacteria bacterium]